MKMINMIDEIKVWSEQLPIDKRVELLKIFNKHIGMFRNENEIHRLIYRQQLLQKTFGGRHNVGKA